MPSASEITLAKHSDVLQNRDANIRLYLLANTLCISLMSAKNSCLNNKNKHRIRKHNLLHEYSPVDVAIRKNYSYKHHEITLTQMISLYLIHLGTVFKLCSTETVNILLKF